MCVCTHTHTDTHTHTHTHTHTNRDSCLAASGFSLAQNSTVRSYFYLQFWFLSSAGKWKFHDKMRLTSNSLTTLTSVNMTYALQFIMALMSPPKYPAPGLFSFCGFPVWFQKTTDYVIPWNQMTSSVKLMSLSEIISEKFHLKLGVLAINMIITAFISTESMYF